MSRDEKYHEDKKDSIKREKVVGDTILNRA